MRNEPTESETSALLSANEEGQISIPCGSACEIDFFLKTLVRLEKMGFVSRKTGAAFYRPFQLTEKGLAVKAAALSKLSTATPP